MFNHILCNSRFKKLNYELKQFEPEKNVPNPDKAHA